MPKSIVDKLADRVLETVMRRMEAELLGDPSDVEADSIERDTIKGKGDPAEPTVRRKRRVRERSLKAYDLTAKGRKFKGELPGTIQDVFSIIVANAPISARRIERIGKLKKKTVESHVWKLRREYKLIESVDRSENDTE